MRHLEREPAGLRAGRSPYQAIADPTRRRILDLLRDAGPQRAGALAARFRRISRPAVSKHLRILRHSRLVRETVRGRERWYALNPQPLREMYNSWLRQYEVFWTERLAALKQIVEADEHARRRRSTDGNDEHQARDRD